MGQILTDTKRALRQWRAKPALALAIVASLAIGLAANIVVFSVVRGVLLRSLPYPHSERIVDLRKRTIEGAEAPFLSPFFVRWRAATRTFAAMGGYIARDLTIGATDPVRVRGAEVSAGLLEVLGVHPSLGRMFSADDESPGTRLAILSHSLWVSRFEARADALGRTLIIENQPYTVIGVMPAGFAGPDGLMQCWLVMNLAPNGLLIQQIGGGSMARPAPLNLLGLLRTAGDLERSVAEGVLFAGQDSSSRSAGVMITPLHERLVGPVRQLLVVMQMAVALLLCLICANLSGLLITAAIDRRREFAVQRALGAPAWAVMRGAVLHGMVPAAAGGLLGTALAWLCLSAFIARPPIEVPRLSEVRLDGAMLAAAALLSLFAGLAASLAPALIATRRHSIETSGGYRVSERTGMARYLIAGEFAIAVVLISGAMLLGWTYRRLVTTDVGLQNRDVLSARLLIPDDRYPQLQARHQFLMSLTGKYQDVARTDVAFSTETPFDPQAAPRGFRIRGRPSPDGGYLQAAVHVVTPNYFATLGIPQRSGRALLPSDSARTSPVATVNEAFARRFLSDSGALGARLIVNDVEWEVVGVVADVRGSKLLAPPEPAFYVSADQVLHHGAQSPSKWYLPKVYLFFPNVERSSGLVQSLRSGLQAIDPALLLDDLQTLEERVARSVGHARLAVLLMMGLSVIGILLAAIGVYGLLANSVSARTRELGVRLALGAPRRTLVRSVLGEAALALILGLAAGSLGSRYLFVALQRAVPETAGSDVSGALTAGLAILVSVALLAAYGPLRRAFRTDPSVALRHD